MLTFMGLVGDDAAERSAKLKALQRYFGTADAKAFNMLDSKALAPSNTERGRDLVVNSHGWGDNFAGLNAEDFYKALVSKGLTEGSFAKIYLMACLVGEQAQDNGILDNFAKELGSILRRAGVSAALYAPRGFLTYLVHEVRDGGTRESYWVVDKMFIESPERDYTLEEGLLLVA